MVLLRARLSSVVNESNRWEFLLDRGGSAKGAPELKTLLAVEAMTLGVNRMAEHAQKRGYKLRLLASDPSIYSDTEGADVLTFPTNDHEQLRAYIRAERNNIGAVFSSTDTWGVIAAELREEFDFPRRFSSSRLKNFRDKEWVQRELSAYSATPVSDFPKIVKPRNGTGSLGIDLVHTEHELEELRASAGDQDAFVTEPYYRGPLYSAEFWSNGNSTVFFGITNRILTAPPVFLENVKTFPHEYGTPWEAEVEQWGKSLLAKLQYDVGFAHVEFIETATGFALVELNARMPGALITPAIDTCTNFDPYALAVADALNMEPHLPEIREVCAGHSHVSIYSTQTGQLRGIEGLDNLRFYPGQPGWIPSKSIGDHITDTTSYKARIGNVYATAATPALAQDRALSASQALTVDVQ